MGLTRRTFLKHSAASGASQMPARPGGSPFTI